MGEIAGEEVGGLEGVCRLDELAPFLFAGCARCSGRGRLFAFEEESRHEVR